MDELIQLRRETVGAAEAAYGDTDVKTIQVLADLARQFKIAGAQAQAEETIDEVVRRFTEKFGAEHDATKRAMVLAANIKAPAPAAPPADTAPTGAPTPSQIE
jgi:hypothetical protein